MKNKTIAITGASGFLGQRLILRLLKLKPKEIRCMAHSEKRMVEAQKKFPRCKWYIGDIVNYEQCELFIRGADIVFHLGALKHIPIAEENPHHAIMTNINGTINVAVASHKNEVEKVIGISTDKACNPLNVYGMTKYLMEQLWWEYNRKGKTKFLACRYGNVAASSGSVFEIWDKLGREGKNLQITVPEMTRYYFKVDDAVDTIFKTIKKGYEDKVYIPKMKAMRMGDVADVFAEHYGVKKELSGNRGGEKIHEELGDGITSDEAPRFSKRQIKKFIKDIGLLK